MRAPRIRGECTRDGSSRRLKLDPLKLDGSSHVHDGRSLTRRRRFTLCDSHALPLRPLTRAGSSLTRSPRTRAPQFFCRSSASTQRQKCGVNVFPASPRCGQPQAADGSVAATAVRQRPACNWRKAFRPGLGYAGRRRKVAAVGRRVYAPLPHLPPSVLAASTQRRRLPRANGGRGPVASVLPPPPKNRTRTKAGTPRDLLQRSAVHFTPRFPAAPRPAGSAGQFRHSFKKTPSTIAAPRCLKSSTPELATIAVVSRASVSTRRGLESIGGPLSTRQPAPRYRRSRNPHSQDLTNRRRPAVI